MAPIPMFGGWSHSAAQRVNAARLLTLGSANNNYCSTLDRVKHACWARHAFDLRARYRISCVRRQGASDDGMSEVG